LRGKPNSLKIIHYDGMSNKMIAKEYHSPSGMIIYEYNNLGKMHSNYYVDPYEILFIDDDLGRRSYRHIDISSSQRRVNSRPF
jgi:hypothetical protein